MTSTLFSRALVLSAVVASSAAGQSIGQDAAPSDDGSHIEISLVTFGPGHIYWERFGHNAIRVRDTVTGADSLYDYGRFSFQEPGYLWNFVRGRSDYWMGSASSLPLMRRYAAVGRAVWIQVLDLTPEQRVELRDFLLWNARPENAYYRYHYFYDNCSTRLRDALDRATGGQIRPQLEAIDVESTLRFHAQRMTADNLPLYTGFVIGLGSPADKPLTAWESTFIPMKLMEYMRDITVSAPDGGQRPLVRAEHTFFAGEIPLPPDSLPRYLPLFLGIGLAFAAGLIFVGLRESKAQTSHKLFASYAVGWSLLMGVGGSVLAFLWIFTDHDTSYWNENLFFFTPIALPIVIALPLGLRRIRGMVKLTVMLAAAVAASSVVGLVVQLLPWFNQVNGQVIALTLPTNVALVITVFMVLGHPARHQPVASVSTA